MERWDVLIGSPGTTIVKCASAARIPAIGIVASKLSTDLINSIAYEGAHRDDNIMCKRHHPQAKELCGWRFDRVIFVQ